MDVDFLLEKINEIVVYIAKAEDSKSQLLFENVEKALKILIVIQDLRDKISKGAGDPCQIAIITLKLDMARDEALDFEFDDAQQWIELAKANAVDLEVKDDVPSSSGDRMGEWEIAEDEEVAGIPLVSIIEGVREEINGIKRAAIGVLFGRTSAMQSSQHTTFMVATGCSRWIWNIIDWMRDLVRSLIPNALLFVGTPAAWSLTILITLAVGFYTLYVSKGETFGANPLGDFLQFGLWGLTSDVLGQSVSKIADKVKPQ